MVAASDVSVKDGKIGGSWIIIDINKETKLENVLYHKEWRKNMIKSAEAIVLLELVKVFERKG